MKKQKEKGKKSVGGKTKDDHDEKKDDSAESSMPKENATTKEHFSGQEASSQRLTGEDEETRPAEPEDPLKAPSKQTHNRQPSLSLQSKLRSSSFRRTSVSQAPLSPPLSGSKSPILPVLSPEGESINDIYRKQTSRLEKLEKENKNLVKEVRDVEARWKKTEEELEDLRESSSEIAELKSWAGKVHVKLEETEKLASIIRFCFNTGEF